MRMKIDTLERERDFYFDKLREIEILCQNKDVASTPVGGHASFDPAFSLLSNAHTLSIHVLAMTPPVIHNSTKRKSTRLLHDNIV